VEGPRRAASFEELAMPLFDSLYNLARWLTRDRAEAEDLVQETFVKALKGFPSFQAGTNFRAWIYRILRNTFLTSRTGLREHASLSLDEDEPPSADTPETELLARADRDSLERALERLPLPHREVILLCDVEEMSYREIAEALGVPAGTVMSRLARARKAMRDLLAAEAGGTWR
jgi:RNA polymerase sigma-70 factor (ECF subfamily)